MSNKISQTAKAKNLLIYDQSHNFNKYKLENFSNISSIESKYSTLEMFYRQFISLKNLDLKTEENIDYKFVVLNLALKEYDELIK